MAHIHSNYTEGRLPPSVVSSSLVSTALPSTASSPTLLPWVSALSPSPPSCSPPSTSRPATSMCPTSPCRSPSATAVSFSCSPACGKFLPASQRIRRKWALVVFCPGQPVNVTYQGNGRRQHLWCHSSVFVRRLLDLVRHSPHPQLEHPRTRRPVRFCCGEGGDPAMGRVGCWFLPDRLVHLHHHPPPAHPALDRHVLHALLHPRPGLPHACLRRIRQRQQQRQRCHSAEQGRQRLPACSLLSSLGTTLSPVLRTAGML